MLHSRIACTYLSCTVWPDRYIIFQYWAIHNKGNLPKSITICQSRFIKFPNTSLSISKLRKTCRILPKRRNLAKSGHTDLVQRQAKIKLELIEFSRRLLLYNQIKKCLLRSLQSEPSQRSFNQIKVKDVIGFFTLVWERERERERENINLIFWIFPFVSTSQFRVPRLSKIACVRSIN